MIMQAELIDKRDPLSAGRLLQFIHDHPSYEKRWFAMTMEARRIFITLPVTMYDVLNHDAMTSIFDKADDLEREKYLNL